MLSNGIPVFSAATFAELETRLWKPKFDRYLSMESRRAIFPVYLTARASGTSTPAAPTSRSFVQIARAQPTCALRASYKRNAARLALQMPAANAQAMESAQGFMVRVAQAGCRFVSVLQGRSPVGHCRVTGASPLAHTRWRRGSGPGVRSPQRLQAEVSASPVIIRSNKWGEAFKPLARPPQQAV